MLHQEEACHEESIYSHCVTGRLGGARRFDGPDERKAGTTDSPFPALLEFSTLGTHKVQLTFGATKSSTAYTDANTYTFHVGPISDLEVRDGAPNPAVPAGQRAFTISAINNGPDTAPAVRVTLTGVPDGARVGGISDGTSYDATTGVWTIGEMETAEYRRGVGRSDGAILTLLTGAAGADIVAEIENTQDYEVCIDSSGNDVATTTSEACTNEDATNKWHTTDYYDYVPGNSTTTVAARHGSGGAALGTRQATVGISLTWPAQPGAAYYGIDVSEDGGATWSVLELWVSGTSYTHRGVPVGATRHYRVHAIDEDRRRGLPFTTASATAQEPRIRTVTRTRTVVEYRDRVSISPAGQPQVGVTLTATLTHYGGEPTDPRWQWERSAGDGAWEDIAGATDADYTPTQRDAGRRLRAIVTYGEPDGSGDSVAGAVTQELPCETGTGSAARYDANCDGRIDLDEALAAIDDYYAGGLDFAGVLEVIDAYLSD